MTEVIARNRRTAKVIGSDPLDDIAVLKIVENSSQLTQQQKLIGGRQDHKL